VDYAGLYPPAALDMRTAVHNYAAYRRTPWASILGRFVIAAARLDEFAVEASTIWPHRQADTSWPISALTGRDVPAALGVIERFNSVHGTHARVDTVETTAEDADRIKVLRALVPESLTTYVEIPSAGDPAPLIEEIGHAGFRAKIRTGGVVASAIPPAPDVARFIVAAARRRVPFKATAGLHHAIRASYALTYEAGSARAVMHGFLNVFVAAALAYDGAGVAEVTALLEETDPGAFVFGDSTVRWRNHTWSSTDLHEMREILAGSFGSCAFHEPVADLQRLRLL
jgi:hypothetical protein